jgi:hypothetical protein
MSNLRVKWRPQQKLIRLCSDLECLCLNVKILQNTEVL